MRVRKIGKIEKARIGKVVWGLALWGLVLGGCGSSVSILKEGQENAQEETQEIKEEGNEELSEVKEEELPQETEFIYVDICGAVEVPGVYQLSRGSRIFQVIEMAGGLLPEAAPELVNQAQVLEDGQQIRVYTRQEVSEMDEIHTLVTESGQEEGSSEINGKVNINRADKAELMTLTGIGETRAEAILAYREQTGGFSSAEELMQVDGIKEKTYEKLKDQITVK